MSRVFTKEWLNAVVIRMVRTFAEAALAYIGTGVIQINDVNWVGVLSAGAMGAALSFLMALAGLPEVKQEPVYEEDEEEWPDEEGDE